MWWNVVARGGDTREGGGGDRLQAIRVMNSSADTRWPVLRQQLDQLVEHLVPWEIGLKARQWNVPVPKWLIVAPPL